MYLRTLTPERQVSESGYRFLDPEFGRWTSRDPIGEIGGPNIYGYVYNHPISLSDALGLIGLAPPIPIIPIQPGFPGLPAPPTDSASDTLTNWKTFGRGPFRCECGTLSVRYRLDASNSASFPGAIGGTANADIGPEVDMYWRGRIATCCPDKYKFRQFVRRTLGGWAPDPTQVTPAYAYINQRLYDYPTTRLVGPIFWWSRTFYSRVRGTAPDGSIHGADVHWKYRGSKSIFGSRTVEVWFRVRCIPTPPGNGNIT